MRVVEIEAEKKRYLKTQKQILTDQYVVWIKTQNSDIDDAKAKYKDQILALQHKWDKEILLTYKNKMNERLVQIKSHNNEDYSLYNGKFRRTQKVFRIRNHSV